MSIVSKYLRLLSFEDVYGSLSKAEKVRLLSLSLVDLELALECRALDLEKARYGL